jgi:hypothetical protein
MNHAKKMVVAGLAVLPSVLGTFSAGQAAPAGTWTDSADAVPASPAGFEHWFRDQCPDGRMLRITTGSAVKDTACEEARAKALANDSARERLVDAYLAQTETPMRDEQPGERTGEAREPWSPLGWLCGMVVGGALAYQCEKVGYNWSQCLMASTIPLTICTLI